DWLAWATRVRALCGAKTKVALQWSQAREEAGFVPDIWVGAPFAESFTVYRGVADLKAAELIDPTRSVILWTPDESYDDLDFVVQASLAAGTPFVDLPLQGIGLSGGVWERDLRVSYGILQATRRRMSKTEYIS